MSGPPRVLVVDDEPLVREVLETYLSRAGFDVDVAGDGDTAVDLALRNHPDLVLLDILLPGMSGLEVLRRIRVVRGVPIILVTAKGEEPDRVIGLEVGADDYVVKPFSAREVVARVRAVLRRSEADNTPMRLERGPFVIDTGRRVVTRDGAEIALTPREFDLLVFLAREPGRTFTRAELLREVWGSSSEWQDPATVTVHVRRLRQKIEPDPAEPRHLVTVFGVGYRFGQ